FLASRTCGGHPSRHGAAEKSLPPYCPAAAILPADRDRAARRRAGAMYRTVTQDIAVEVEPSFMADRSDPAAHRYFWAYSVTIINNSDRAVTLVSRYWHITDAAGRVEEVRGPGVVGEQPVLGPGDSY